MDQLLERSQLFDAALDALLEDAGYCLVDDSPKHVTCANACVLSNEHASTLRLAFAIGTPNSGAALMRLQYEAVLRGAWVLHAASDEQIARLTVSLDKEAETQANKLPSADEMRKSVASSAPAGLANPLTEFRESNWKSLNSFIHGGIHPLRRIEEGFPVALAENVVRNSNGLLHMSYRLLASLSGSPELMAQVTNSYRAFNDCLPLVATPSASKSG